LLYRGLRRGGRETPTASDIASKQPRHGRQGESALPDPPAFRSYSRLCEFVAVWIVRRTRPPILTLQGLWSGPARPNGTCLFTAGLSDSDVPIINPENPTPGTRDMTGYLYQAFATDLNDRMRDNGKPNLEAVVE